MPGAGSSKIRKGLFKQQCAAPLGSVDFFKVILGEEFIGDVAHFHVVVFKHGFFARAERVHHGQPRWTNFASHFFEIVVIRGFEQSVGKRVELCSVGVVVL